jgi:hypothetical protein
LLLPSLGLPDLETVGMDEEWVAGSVATVSVVIQTINADVNPAVVTINFCFSPDDSRDEEDFDVPDDTVENIDFAAKERVFKLPEINLDETSEESLATAPRNIALVKILWCHNLCYERTISKNHEEESKTKNA